MVLSFFRKPRAKNFFFGQKTFTDLSAILLKKGFLNSEQINYIIQEATQNKKRPESVILERGWVSEENLALSFSILFNIPLIHLPGGPISPEILRIIPRNLALSLYIIPFQWQDDTLKIGVVDPFLLGENPQPLEEVLKKNQLTPQFFIISFSDFRRALTNYQHSAVSAAREEVPDIELKPQMVPYNIISKLPREIAEKYKIVIFDFVPDKLVKVATVDPYNPKISEILASISHRTGLTVEKYKISQEDFEKVITAYESKPSFIQKIEPVVVEDKFVLGEGQVASEVEKEISALLEKEITSKEELQKVIDSGHIPKIVAAVINYALSQRATDVHIQPYTEKILVRFRIDGLLRDIAEMPKPLLPAIVSRVKILSKLKIDEQRMPQDGRFKVNFKSKEVDIRVSTLPTSNGEKVVLRLLDKSFGVLTLEQLGLQGKGFADLVAEINKPYGVILSTGPTGCGKTTTLYAILNRIKNPTINIITLEDPVEYEIEGANQAQIHPEIGFTFSTGLRSILRQDPNIIMVGEIRDAETASLVTHAALTGHLVLTTLHTNDAASALPRLINMGVEPFLITSSVNAIIAQRLLRRVCPRCQEEIKLAPGVMSEIEKEIADIPPKILEELKIQKPYRLRKGKGCDYCDNGYRGRIGIFEVLVMTSKIEDIAVKRRPAVEISEAAKAQGMITMRQDGILKVLQGLTTYDEVLRVISVE